MKAYFSRMQDYNHWANLLVLDNIRTQPAPESAAGLLSHLVLAEKAWLMRLEGTHPDFPVFQVLNLADLESQILENHTRWQQVLQQEADFEREISYKTFAGDPFISRLSDILAHVFNHGTYHRAQIASQMRQAGLQPVATDFIRFSRLN